MKETVSAGASGSTQKTAADYSQEIMAPYLADQAQAQNDVRDAKAYPAQYQAAVATAIANLPTNAGGNVYSPFSAADNISLEQGNQSGSQIINDLLKEWGLDGLASTVWNNFKAGDPAAKITDFIRSTPQYSARFPGIAALAKKGQAITEADYINKEVADQQVMRAYLGTSSGLWTDRNTLGNLIANQVSTSELSNRLQAAQSSVLSADPATVQFLKDNYGLTSGDLTAYFLNPDKALADIQRRADAGQLGGVASEAGFGISGNQADQLAAAGVNPASSRSTFAQLGLQGQLQQGLPGDTSTGQVSQDQLLKASFLGDASSQKALSDTIAKRKAVFQDNGGFATDNQGVAGLGVASTR